MRDRTGNWGQINLLSLSLVCSSFEPRLRVTEYSLPSSMNILRICVIVKSFVGRPSMGGRKLRGLRCQNPER